MKTYFSSKIGLAFGLVLMLMFTSCQSDEYIETSVVEEHPEMTEEGEESDPTLRLNNSLIFPTTARLFGKSSEEWAIELGKASVDFNCDNVLKPQMLSLSDKVIAPYGGLDDSTDEYTITKDQFVLISPAFFLNNYPCPAEFDWEPAQGQSLEDFLKEYAEEIINTIETVEVIFDGIAIQEVSKYRISTDLFYFIGNPALVECYDPCITGEPQPGLVDGYFMMFKKMKTGKHTIVLRGDIPSEEFTYESTIVLNVTN